MEIVRDNVRDYVRQGGSLYVSDLASDFVSQLWPDKVIFDVGNRQSRELDPCCICTACDEACIRDEPTPPTAQCSIPNDLPDDCRMPAGPNGNGPAGEFEARIISPFLRQFVDNDEFLVNFEVAAWVEIDAISNDVEVLVNGLVNGNEQPFMVLFEPYPGGGRVVYTSFHNHVQATDSMLQILQALVFRL